MSESIEAPEDLTGKDVHDQLGRKLGEVKRLYAPGGDGDPMWAAVDMPEGMFKRRIVFIPLARLKDEDGAILTPYSKQYIDDAPEVELSDELSSEDDRLLRDYYGLHEIRSDTESYASQLPDGDGPQQAI
jgi:PRC-barrel domain